MVVVEFNQLLEDTNDHRVSQCSSYEFYLSNVVLYENYSFRVIEGYQLIQTAISTLLLLWYFMTTLNTVKEFLILLDVEENFFENFKIFEEVRQNELQIVLVSFRNQNQMILQRHLNQNIL